MKIIRFTLIAIFMAGIFPVVSQAQINIGLEPAIGMPAGSMDFSVDVSAFARKELSPWGAIDFRIQNSFSTKGDGYQGRLYSNVLSGYLLGRLIVASYIEDITPYIAPGIGMHFMYARANRGNFIPNESEWTITAKGHVFYGLEHRLTGSSYLFFQGRMTFPGDKLFDCWYLGYGARIL